MPYKNGKQKLRLIKRCQDFFGYITNKFRY